MLEPSVLQKKKSSNQLLQFLIKTMIFLYHPIQYAFSRRIH